MNQSDIEEDLRFFMNSQSAHNLILRALLKQSPNVAEQLRVFLDEIEAENEDQQVVFDEAKKLLPSR